MSILSDETGTAWEVAFKATGELLVGVGGLANAVRRTLLSANRSNWSSRQDLPVYFYTVHSDCIVDTTGF